jgi:hypothetical protein
LEIFKNLSSRKVLEARGSAVGDALKLAAASSKTPESPWQCRRRHIFLPETVQRQGVWGEWGVSGCGFFEKESKKVKKLLTGRGGLHRTSLAATEQPRQGDTEQLVHFQVTMQNERQLL